jgi:uncharacterized membrane protein YeaQ/YmgE (transglycosylase-associated protein family)
MEFFAALVASPFICLGWIIVGAIAGSLARTIMKSSDMPFINDLLLGIAGAFIGGILAGLVGVAPGTTTSGFELVLANFVISTIGAIILIALGRMLRGR